MLLGDALLIRQPERFDGIRFVHKQIGHLAGKRRSGRFCWAQVDSSKTPPALFEFGVGAFPDRSDRAQQCVVAAIVVVEVTALDRAVHPDAGPLVALVGQRRHPIGGCPLQRAQEVCAGSGDVVGAARFDLAGPHRESVRVGEDLNVGALGLVLARVPQVTAVVGALVDPIDLDERSLSSVRCDQPSRLACSSTSCR